jgi:hypothetical protein
MKPLRKLSKYPTEKGIWQRITGALNHSDRRAYRIESAITPGFPDAIWVTEKKVIFIELKAGPMRFRQMQVKFIKDMHTLGVTVWVISQLVKQGDIFVFPGIDAINWPECEESSGIYIEEWLEEMTNG